MKFGPEKISLFQLSLLLFTTVTATAVFFVPALLAKQSGVDAWINTLTSATLYGFLVAFICIQLGRRFPGQTFPEYLPQIIGKWPGRLLAMVYLALFLHLATVMISEIAHFIHVTFLNQTPHVAVVLLVCAAIFYGAFCGIETIARANVLVLFLFLIGSLVSVLLLIPEIHPAYMLPFLEHGWRPILKGSAITCAWRGEVFALLMLYPAINRPQKAIPAVFGTIFLIGVYLTVITVVCFTVFGAEVTSRLVFALYSLIQYILIGDIITRLELWIVVFWIALALTKTSVFIYAAGSVFHTLAPKLPRSYLFLIMLPVATVVAEMFYASYFQIIRFITFLFPIMALIGELLIPALILVIALVRGKSQAEPTAASERTNTV
ncbi:MAG: GerAB/ArcD/ProY family transporter [Solirubrobacterales bacterium]